MSDPAAKNTKTCRCGVVMTFARTPKGASIPLVRVQHTYRLQEGHAIPVADIWQSHYVDCPYANEFSGRNRERPKDEGGGREP